jgi:hypothetical protein
MRSRGVACPWFSGYTRRVEMGGPIHKFWMCRVTEAWYQLSEEEQNSLLAKTNNALKAVGGKSIVTYRSDWSSE